MKYLFIQNLIAPYRTSLFNSLYDKGLDFEVLYMCELENDRKSWIVDYNGMHFPYQVLQGFYKTIKGIQVHWDPKIIKYIKKNPDAEVILGGSWNYLDIVAICFMKRIGFIKNKLIFWAEANYLSGGAHKKNKLRDWVRKYIYYCGDGTFIVPGQMSVETYKRWGIEVKRFVFLPNVIEEEKFKCVWPRKKANHDRPVFVFPAARMFEATKGMLNFFDKLGLENIRRAKFFLIGEGGDKEKMECFVKDNKLEEHICFTGSLSMDEMVARYMDADILLQPSLSDPSPLALVEGICCGLPMLVSNRCGNHFETVFDGENGYTFDPLDGDSLRKAFELLMSRKDEWHLMGKKSRDIFETNLKQEIVVSKLIEQLRS